MGGICNDAIIVAPIFENQETLKYTQVIRGKVLDAEAQSPLPFATITVQTTDPTMGAIADENGTFHIKNIPIGRHNVHISFIGYETQVIPELLVTTGKEVVLNVYLKERVSELKEVRVTAFTKKDKPQNSMSTLSARTFSVEEARRYAGGFDDPGRLATAFAGVTTEGLRDNTIIIRGNSPKGLLWRLEGVEVPNPNHFANMSTFGGGGISAISALVMGNSDFFTGAFPAEYGNAMSGVFDIILRTGNNEKYEHAIQVGALGVDVSSEGPLRKGSRASYLFNYRYSTMGLVRELFPREIKSFLPIYQDLCFKVNVPTNKAGIISLWGLASADRSSLESLKDTSEWETVIDRMVNNFRQSFGAIGLNHRYIFKQRAWLNTSFAVTGDYWLYNDQILDYNLTPHDFYALDVLNYRFTFTSVYNHKFSARHANRTGIVMSNLNYDLNMKYSPNIGMPLQQTFDERGSSDLAQVYTQSKFNITNDLTLNAGVHSTYFELNNELVVEPRFGISYTLSNSQSFSLGYGKHSRLEPLSLYFSSVSINNEVSQPNKGVRLAKAHHIVFAYDRSFTPNLRMKIEPYMQMLYDVPVIPDSSFSVLNIETEWLIFHHELINSGTGKNIGIDFTLERFLNEGYYFLITSSVFSSRYRGGNGIEYSTRFDTRYVLNLLYGKEWILGGKKNKILGINSRLNFFGGRRYTPFNQELSAAIEDVVIDASRMYEGKEAGKYHVNVGVNYRINRRNHTSIWSFQMINVLLAKENYGYSYNYKTKRVEPWLMAIPAPNLSYKIEF